MDDFNFYLKFAKPLVLNLPDAKDRTIAALWVKKLGEMQSDGPEANMRIEYLKLLLFVMQRNRLAGIFEKAPPEGPLQSFPPNYKATDMLSLVKPEKSAPPAYPPVYTSVGGDLCQFVAVQEIPNFGLHGYYAISMEPLSKWSHASTNAAKKATTKPKHYTDCFKDTCKLVESTYCMKNSDDPESPASPSAQSPAKQKPAESSGPLDSGKTNSLQQNECENVPMPQFVPLPPIPFQSFRREIAGFESRPTWGRSRCIERLIDESPHMNADLDMSEADAMLHGISEKTFKKAERFGPCAISNSRQHVERLLDLPPCAVDPGEVKVNTGSVYTCRPKREQTIETHTDICHNERDFYPCGQKPGFSLRGGSDSGSCCNPQNQGSRSHTSLSDDDPDRNRRYHRPAGLSPRPRLQHQANRNDSSRHFGGRTHRLQTGSIFDDTDDPLDVDTSIHETMTARTFIDPDSSGNFKWLEEMEHIHFSDPADTSCVDFECGSRMKPFSSDTMTNELNHLETEGYSESYDESSINEQLQPQKLMPQVARRMQSPKLCRSRRAPSMAQQPPSRSCNTRPYAHDYWDQQIGLRQRNSVALGEDNSEEEDTEPSIAVVRRRFAKSREATKRDPEVHETSFRWKEIIDQQKSLYSRTSAIVTSTAPPSPPRSRDEALRSEDSGRMSSRDLEYLAYLEATGADCGHCYEDDEDEDIEAPARNSRRIPGQSLDGEESRFTKNLLRPPKPMPSPGRVVMPLSKQNLRRKATARVRSKEPSNVKIDTDADAGADEDESK